MGHSEFDPGVKGRRPWNAGRKLGARRALKPQQVWAVRFWLDHQGRLRDRAMFDLAIDSKLRGCGGSLPTRSTKCRDQTLRAQVLATGRYPVTGRFNLGTVNPRTVDGTERVRGIGFQVRTPDGQEWRSSMIDLPFFPVATPQAFYELLVASGRRDDPDAMKRFAVAHPEIAAFGAWAGSAPFTQSYAEERYNALNSFVFTDATGTEHTVRWSLVPVAQPVFVSADEMKARGPDFLESEIAQRVAVEPQRWTLSVTIAEPGDPTADPSKAWPESRRSIDVGTLVVDRILPEPDGPCREINFDPTVLPAGMRTSDDPFPAARAAAYSVSYNRRTSEANHYPRTATEARK